MFTEFTPARELLEAAKNAVEKFGGDCELDDMPYDAKRRLKEAIDRAEGCTAGDDLTTAANELYRSEDIVVPADALVSDASGGSWVSAWVWVPAEPNVECDNCGHRCHEDDLGEISDLLMRVSPGEEMPVGECPACGALAHYIKEV